MLLPLAAAGSSPVPVSADYYYHLPVKPIYKSYPVYAAGKEPADYLQRLQQQEPEIVFDSSKLHTKEDWIRAGARVFEAPDPAFFDIPVAALRSPLIYANPRMPVAKDGTIPFVRYVVREKGKVEGVTFSCAMCHTRVMPDGSVIKGAQGNIPFETLSVPPGSAESARGFERLLFGAPWRNPDPLTPLASMSYQEIVAAHASIPPGVMARHGTNVFFPVKVPDLIGLKERKFFDATGLVQHRGIGDLMRYAAWNQGGDLLAHYGDFVPAGKDFCTLPDPTDPKLGRYSDEQLYALSLYLYSLQSPRNPHRFDALAAHGKNVFQREGCVSCHAPPLYTNNMLVPATAQVVSSVSNLKDSILPIIVATDPSLALETRRGTGYYKVPSLKGCWYRSMFGHGGWCALLEDWFDPQRTRSDYVPLAIKATTGRHIR